MLAYVFINTFYAALIHLLLAFPDGRLATARHRLLAAAGYFIAIGLQIPPLLFLKTPDEDICSDCPENLLLVMDSHGDQPGAVRAPGAAGDRADDHGRGDRHPPLASRTRPAARRARAGRLGRRRDAR